MKQDIQQKALALVLLTGALWLLLDQVTKYLAVAHLTTLLDPADPWLERVRIFMMTDNLHPLATAPVPVVKGLWEHVYVQNDAAAFGLLSSLPLGARRAVLILVAVGASVALPYYGWRMAALHGRIPWLGRLVQICLGLVLGGAVGNVLDRSLHGYVIDFIHWHYKSYSWPPFNIADTGIVVGVFTLVVFLGRAEAEPEGAAKAKEKGKK